MTTIATDGRTIAADRMVVYGGEERARYAERKVRVDGGVAVVASAGKPAVCEAVATWLVNREATGILDQPFPDAAVGGHAFGVLVAMGDNRGGVRWMFVNEDDRAPRPIGLPFALGTGERWALGAMLAGASPERAVEIAIECDLFSGGGVDVVDVFAALVSKDRRR